MIYKETPQSVKKVGEIKSNKVGIQSKDISFILSILSSNLYSNPIGSLIREYVSNAVDSHKEAGVEEPVIVSLYLDSEKDFWFSVRDFGVGISPERFNEVFINLASSTKRESNEYLGMWGLGRLSGLSYSDSVTITSNYNGTAATYLMYKDGTDINIDELYSEETNEGNGVEIKIKLKNSYKDAYSFITELPKQLLFFDSVYFDIDEEILGILDSRLYYTYSSGEAKDIYRQLKNLKIKRYKTFCVSSYRETKNYGYQIVLGNVQYKLDESKVNCELPPLGIFPMFQVGELEVTPNREEIQYSDKNIKVINDRIYEVLEETDEVYKPELTRDFKYLNTFLNGKRSGSIDLMKSDKHSNPIPIWDTSKLTFHGKKIYLGEKYVFNCLDAAYHTFSPSYILTKDKLKATKCKLKASDLIIENEKGNLLICDIKKLSKKALAYLETKRFKETEPIYIFKDFPEPRRTDSDYDNLDWAIREDIKMIPTFTEKDVPKSFVYEEDTSEEDTTSTKDLFKFKLAREHRNDEYSVVFDSYSFSSEEGAMSNFHEKTAFYYGYEEDERLLSDLFLFTKDVYDIKPKFLKVNKNFKAPEGFIHVKEFFEHKNFTLDRLYVEFRILRELRFLDNVRISDVKMYNEEFSNLLYDYMAPRRGKNIERLTSKYLRLQLEKYTNPNSEVIKNFEDNYENLKKLYVFYVFRNQYSTRNNLIEESLNLLTDYIITKNLFPVKQEMIDKLNKETIFNNHLTIRKYE